jgi:hypothetical protein
VPCSLASGSPSLTKEEAYLLDCLAYLVQNPGCQLDKLLVVVANAKSAGAIRVLMEVFGSNNVMDVTRCGDLVKTSEKLLLFFNCENPASAAAMTMWYNLRQYHALALPPFQSAIAFVTTRRHRPQLDVELEKEVVVVVPSSSFDIGTLEPAVLLKFLLDRPCVNAPSWIGAKEENDEKEEESYLLMPIRCLWDRLKETGGEWLCPETGHPIVQRDVPTKVPGPVVLKTFLHQFPPACSTCRQWTQHLLGRALNAHLGPVVFNGRARLTTSDTRKEAFKGITKLHRLYQFASGKTLLEHLAKTLGFVEDRREP